jgi:methylmalonyl-CoA mutase N-terminal domain/subunit
VEALTDRIEAEAEAIFARIRELGGGDEARHGIGPMTSGILRGIEEGWFTSHIAESAFAYQQALEKGDKKIVGVNCHTATVTKELEILRISHEVEVEQKRVLAGRRGDRDRAAVDAALARMVEVARGDDNLIPAMLDAARAEATLGDICDALRREWGVYREPARF